MGLNMGRGVAPAAGCDPAPCARLCFCAHLAGPLVTERRRDGVGEKYILPTTKEGDEPGGRGRV